MDGWPVHGRGPSSVETCLRLDSKLCLPSLPMKLVPFGHSSLQMNCFFPLTLQPISRPLSSGIISSRFLQPGFSTSSTGSSFSSSSSSGFSSSSSGLSSSPTHVPSGLLNFQMPFLFFSHFALALPFRV